MNNGYSIRGSNRMASYPIQYVKFFHICTPLVLGSMVVSAVIKGNSRNPAQKLLWATARNSQLLFLCFYTCHALAYYLKHENITQLAWHVHCIWLSPRNAGGHPVNANWAAVVGNSHFIFPVWKCSQQRHHTRVAIPSPFGSPPPLFFFSPVIFFFSLVKELSTFPFYAHHLLYEAGKRIKSFTEIVSFWHLTRLS